MTAAPSGDKSQSPLHALSEGERPMRNKPQMTLEDAYKIAEAVRAAAAKRNGSAGTIAIVDSGGHLLYLGHALENFVDGVGGPADPAILPGLADLARASQGLRVVEMAHLLRPQGDRQAVDVLLHVQPWDPDQGWSPQAPGQAATAVTDTESK